MFEKPGKKHQMEVHLVEELVKPVLEGEDTVAWCSARMIPYVMWSLEQLLAAHDLRDRLKELSETSGVVSCEPPPISGLLPAITRAACDRSFSLERLEVLGDAFLKWEVSCQLYETHTTWAEGDLSQLRSQVICAPFPRTPVTQSAALTSGAQYPNTEDKGCPSPAGSVQPGAGSQVRRAGPVTVLAQRSIFALWLLPLEPSRFAHRLCRRGRWRGKTGQPRALRGGRRSRPG